MATLGDSDRRIVRPLYYVAFSISDGHLLTSQSIGSGRWEVSVYVIPVIKMCNWPSPTMDSRLLSRSAWRGEIICGRTKLQHHSLCVYCVRSSCIKWPSMGGVRGEEEEEEMGRRRPVGGGHVIQLNL